MASLVVVVLTATLGGVLVSESASGRAADPARAAAGGSAQLRVLTYNIEARAGMDRFVAAVQSVLPYGDIVGLQEINSRFKLARLDQLRTEGWATWREIRTDYYADVRRGSATQTPVLWRADRFDFVGGWPIRISAATSLGGELPVKAGNGRWVSVVRLRDKLTGQAISIVNAHLVQGAVKAGRKVKRHPRTWRLYRSQVAAVATIAAGERNLGQQVFLMGDFNSDYVSDAKRGKRAMPVRKFRSIGLSSMWATSRPKKGTRGRAFLDQVFTTLRPAATQVLRGIRLSDHLPALATYLLPQLPGYPQAPPTIPSSPTTSPSATESSPSDPESSPSDPESSPSEPDPIDPP